MMTLEQLIDAYKSGKLTEPLMLDNDTTHVYIPIDEDWTDATQVFEMHPYDLMSALLDYVGIPHEGV